jgi:hypothetical protein
MRIRLALGLGLGLGLDKTRHNRETRKNDGQDKVGQYNIRQDKTKTRQDRTTDKTRQDKA